MTEKTIDEEKDGSKHYETIKISPSFEEISKPRLIFFVSLMVISQFLTQSALAQTVVPFHYIADTLKVDSPGEMSWFSASYSLTVGTFILIAGQLGDLFGYKKLYIFGYCWFGIWNLVCGFTAFTHNSIFFNIVRALVGIGPAICVPNSLALLGNFFSHGSTHKNISMSIFGGVAPLGFVIGAIFSSLISQHVWWPWQFWILGILCFLIASLGLFFIPNGIIHHYEKDGWKQFDIYGSITGVIGLVLFNFAWNQGPVVGWDKPYVYVLLIIGIISIGLFFYIELYVSKRPLVPRDVLTGDIGLVLACIVTGWSCFGVWLYYCFQFSELIEKHSPLISSVHMIPTIFAGLIASLSTSYLLKKFSTSVVMIIALSFFLIGISLMGTIPKGQTYWSQKFVSNILTPFGMDISFPAATIVLSHHLSNEHQGIAASVVATSVNYSISIGLGIAGTVQTYIESEKKDIVTGIKSAFYTGIGLAGLGVITGLIFAVKQRSIKSI